MSAYKIILSICFLCVLFFTAVVYPCGPSPTPTSSNQCCGCGVNISDYPNLYTEQDIILTPCLPGGYFGSPSGNCGYHVQISHNTIYWATAKNTYTKVITCDGKVSNTNNLGFVGDSAWALPWCTHYGSWWYWSFYCMWIRDSQKIVSTFSDDSVCLTYPIGVKYREEGATYILLATTPAGSITYPPNLSPLPLPPGCDADVTFPACSYDPWYIVPDPVNDILPESMFYGLSDSCAVDSVQWFCYSDTQQKINFSASRWVSYETLYPLLKAAGCPYFIDPSYPFSDGKNYTLKYFHVGFDALKYGSGDCGGVTANYGRTGQIGELLSPAFQEGFGVKNLPARTLKTGITSGGHGGYEKRD